MAEIIWTKEALEDIKLIHQYIARDSVFQADHFIDRIIEEADRLERFPDLGRVIPELNNVEKREIIIGSYRLMYHLKDHSVGIIGVIHGARDFRG